MFETKEKNKPEGKGHFWRTERSRPSQLHVEGKQFSLLVHCPSGRLYRLALGNLGGPVVPAGSSVKAKADGRRALPPPVNAVPVNRHPWLPWSGAVCGA